MNTWRGLDSLPHPLDSASLAIGVFDGVHVGHQTIIRSAVEDARKHGRAAAVLTFDRHPLELIAPDQAPGRLTTDSQRIRLLEQLGVDDLVIAAFDERFRELSPEGFLRFVVCGILGARSVFVGFDFRFGKNQEGDTDYLRSTPTRCEFDVRILDPILVDGEKASSSRIRASLARGDVETAARILGRPYSLAGTVVEGEKLGRKLGFPTANLQSTETQVIPADGIYAVWTKRGADRIAGACSIGKRPTVGGTSRTVEVYLLDFEGDLYGEQMEVEFIARLRDELKFDSLDALVRQMVNDIEQTINVLGVRSPGPTPNT